MHALGANYSKQESDCIHTHTHTHMHARLHTHHTHTHTHTRTHHTHTHTTHTYLYFHCQNWICGPHSGGEPAEGNMTGGPIGSGDTNLISSVAWPPQCTHVKFPQLQNQRLQVVHCTSPRCSWTWRSVVHLCLVLSPTLLKRPHLHKSP